MDELFECVFLPKTPIVENLLEVGTYLFVGSPKVGKSFFMAQLGYAISTGKDLFGLKVARGDVLYLALEDNYERLQRRLSTMYGTESVHNLHLAISAKTLKGGLLKQLEGFMAEHSDTKLIVIDTLKKIRDTMQEQFSYNSDYEIMDELKGFADKHQICLLIVHHARKQVSEDIFDTISGSNGLMGAADGAFVMSKKNRISSKAILDVVGRDHPDQRFQLAFNRSEWMWELVAIEHEVLDNPKVPLLEDIAKILTEDSSSFQGSANELIQRLESDEYAPSTIM